jgi:hypothetical protein
LSNHSELQARESLVSSGHMDTAGFSVTFSIANHKGPIAPYHVHSWTALLFLRLTFLNFDMRITPIFEELKNVLSHCRLARALREDGQATISATALQRSLCFGVRKQLCSCEMQQDVYACLISWDRNGGLHVSFASGLIKGGSNGRGFGKLRTACPPPQFSRSMYRSIAGIPSYRTLLTIDPAHRSNVPTSHQSRSQVSFFLPSAVAHNKTCSLSSFLYSGKCRRAISQASVASVEGVGQYDSSSSLLASLPRARQTSIMMLSRSITLLAQSRRATVAVWSMRIV